MKVAVLGATGTVGRALVPLLAERDEVVAISRRASPTTNGVCSVAADVTDGEALGRALEGVDVLYYLVHSLDTADFHERDRIAATTTARPSERVSARSSTSVASGTSRPTFLLTCEAAPRRPNTSHPDRCP